MQMSKGEEMMAIWSKDTDERVDSWLWKIIESRWSAVIVAGYSLFWYFMGYYVGDILHWIGQLG